MDENTVSEKISLIRYEYMAKELSRNDLEPNPVKQFEKWMDEALKSDIAEANAMTLSTIAWEGFPASRIVLLREFDNDGFVFYTNYLSDKGNELKINPKAALNFFWPQIQRQIRIQGVVEKVEAETSDNYFNSRPRLSQISAWASKQSSQLDSRKRLEADFDKFQAEFKDKAIKRPDNWGGYRVKPISIEFWQGRLSRLHDRFVYKFVGDKWEIKRCSP